MGRLDGCDGVDMGIPEGNLAAAMPGGRAIFAGQAQ
jgi:hypothetical protein